ncbi:hypothetical protein PTSG_02399 [Salpingoeca rosetta]|uniref:Uncharacterized protein n=1 Tax=Salpingoeca rosetta (strain ATCC 50818 / BSB-021) TaxID=946362 RepID=F2U233_SALR5|nr:uncharacterized protein PTSG_02399 [Salpingoeca rosetta]EGD81685.1 hypothetical protein PTSG_02399 [Salpingoeca rosetta]|eukprot:XP_004996889.1 hypothetical protein PTSG_02399 [Salpingoeca rosetta]
MMAMSGFSMSPAAPSLLPPSPHPRPQRQSPAPASSSSASSSAASASATGTTPGRVRAASGLATRAASASGTQSSVRKDEAEEYDSATSDEDGALDDLDEADLLRSQPSAARNPSPHTPARRRRTRSPPRQPLSREVGSPRKEQGSSAKQPRRAREAPPSPHSKHPDQQLKKKKKHLAQHRPAEHKRPHRFQIKHESLMAMTEEDMIAQAKRASLRDAYLHRPPAAAKRGARMVPAHEADHEDDDDDGRTGDQRAGDHTVTDDEDMLLQIALAQSLQEK